MDDEIPGTKKDKARERLDEFLKDRFPSGIPPENRPSPEVTPEEGAAKKKRRKTKTLRKR
jgi:hypothetical protein